MMMAFENGWLPIDGLRFDGREIIVGVWVDSSQGWRWSSWTTPAENPLGCDGEWGDEPTHFAALPSPPPLPTQEQSHGY